MDRTSVPTAPPLPARSTRDQFLDIYDQEHARTMKVLRAFPKDKGELRPHPKAKNAKELAWTFVIEQVSVEKALTIGFDWTKPMTLPNAPETFEAILDAFQKGHDHIRGLISVQRDEELCETMPFQVGPGRLEEWTKIDVLRQVLHDQIHHRGQFSVYLRMADAKVPAIYGPSLDEPWL